jgi:mono/diheme cytochrome c family protein
MRRLSILLWLLGAAAGLAISAIAQERDRSKEMMTMSAPSTRSNSENSTTASATHSSPTTSDRAEGRTLRLEGEKRFRTNCGRCHMAPHKFPPRVMAAAIRHMRVRAMITDEDMRLILHYMTR